MRRCGERVPAHSLCLDPDGCALREAQIVRVATIQEAGILHILPINEEG